MRFSLFDKTAELIVCQELYIDPRNEDAKVAILVSLPTFGYWTWDSFGISRFDVVNFPEKSSYLRNYGFN